VGASCFFFANNADDLTGSKGIASLDRTRLLENVVKSLNRNRLEHTLALSDTYKARGTTPRGGGWGVLQLSPDRCVPRRVLNPDPIELSRDESNEN